MAGVGGGKALRAAVALIVAAGLLCGFYLWTASAGLPLGFGEAQDRHYNLLTQALLRGQLHIDVEPRPELFELSEPYRPGRNAPYRFHDASLYRGRYFLYFGVVPVLVAFGPWRLAGLGDLPEPAAAAGFALVGFVFSALLLWRLLREHLPAPPRTLPLILAFLMLGLSNVAPFILRSSHVYEVAIAAGFAFSASAAWLFASAGSGETVSLRRLSLAGLLLGLAVGCRPNLVFMVPILPLLAVPRGFLPSWRAALRPALAVMAPLALCALGLGLYNHARFDSWTEFGTRYQLVGVEPIARLESRAMIPTLYYDFLAPPALRIDFPFVFPDHDWAWTLPEGYFLDSSTTGAFAHTPYLLILLALPWVLRGAAVREPGELRRRLGVLVAAGVAVPLATAFAFASTAMRFQADFVHLLLVPAIVLWFVLATRIADPRRRVFRAIVALVFGWSAFAAVAISLTGVDALRRSNPDLFASLERRAEPLRRMAGLFASGTRVVVPLRVAFPERTAEDEPFLSWGSLEAFDVLRVRTVSPGVFAFSLDTAAERSRSGTAPPETAGVGFVPGRFYDVTVDVDRVRRRVKVAVDGQDRVELGGHLVPVAPQTVWPGRGPRGGGAQKLGRFSGTLIPEAMWLAGPPGLESLPPIAAAPALVTASRDDAPETPGVGRLWAIAGHRGARIFTGAEWRWIPAATVESLVFEQRLGDLPGAAAGEITPILVSQEDDGADALVVRDLGSGRVGVALARWDDGWSLGVEGPPISAGQLSGGLLQVRLDRREQLVVVTLDGDEVLRARSELRPLRPEGLQIGRMPRPRGAGANGAGGDRD